MSKDFYGEMKSVNILVRYW